MRGAGGGAASNVIQGSRQRASAHRNKVRIGVIPCGNGAEHRSPAQPCARCSAAGHCRSAVLRSTLAAWPCTASRRLSAFPTEGGVARGHHGQATCPGRRVACSALPGNESTKENTDARPFIERRCADAAPGVRQDRCRQSTLSQQLALKPRHVLISEDTWLAALYPGEIHSIADYLQRAATLRNVLADHLRTLLQAGVSVVLDFPFNTPASRAWAREVFSPVGATSTAFPRHCR